MLNLFNLFDICSMIYTAIYRQHISNVYATVELLYFCKASSWAVCASLTLLALITVVACCFIVMNYYQKVSLNLNNGAFLTRMNHISKYTYWVGCSCVYCCCLAADSELCFMSKYQE